MKKLTIYALIVSVLIAVMYSIKIHFLIQTDSEFYQASFLTLVGEIGLFVAYYIARDYEAIKAQEEHHERLRQHYENMVSSLEEESKKEH